jgi:hypothetical protein
MPFPREKGWNRPTRSCTARFTYCVSYPSASIEQERTGQRAGAGTAFSFASLLFSFPATESASCSNSASSFPSTASFKSDIVLSMLRLRVLGLVIVVPRLACRAWPRRNGVIGPELDVGEVGVSGPIGLDGALEITSSNVASTPLGDSTPFTWESPAGV